MDGRAGYRGRTGRKMWDRFVEFFSRGYFKGRDGPAFEDTELANYVQKAYINYSGVL
jgi:hypothetical protein